MTTDRNPKPALQLVGVSKAFDGVVEGTEIKVLDRVNVSFVRGELVCIIGKSGVGKSTLMNIAGGSDSADCGEVFLRGTRLDFQAADSHRGRIGYVQQKLNLFPHLGVMDNVTVALRLRDGLGPEEARLSAEFALAHAGISHLAGRKPGSLSGGEQTRVAVARVKAEDPDVVLMDEPTTGLDDSNARAIINLIASMAHELGRAVVVSTHDDRLVSRADRVLRLFKGKLLDVASRSDTDTASVGPSLMLVANRRESR